MKENPKDKAKTIGDFWEKNSGNEVKIFTDKLIEFCSKKLNYCNYLDHAGNYILVKVSRNSIIEEAKIETLQQEIKHYLKDEKKEKHVWAAFANRDLLTKHFMDLLEVIPEINFNQSSKNKAFFYYRNGVVKITEKSCELISYENFQGKVWKQQINNREFLNCNLMYEDAVFNRFLKNISGNNVDRYNSIFSILGYILHPYKDSSFTKAVILLDSNIDFTGTANGGTGKSILAKAVGYITTTLFKDGKRYNPNESFVYDDVRPYHRVLYFDDVKKNFPFDEFYATITGGMRVTKKYKDASFIPPELSPKLFISSNYMVRGTGGDTDERRRIEFEVSPFYSISHTPKDDFGHTFFDDWDTQEWALFDVMMLRSVNYFIKHGVVSAPNINLSENKIKLLTDPDFVTFLDGTISYNARYDKAILIDDFRRICPKFRITLTSIEFKRWLDQWARFKGLDVLHSKSNGKAYVTFIEKINPEQE